MIYAFLAENAAAMVGKRPHVSVLASDEPTQDGTGTRDYLHIDEPLRCKDGSEYGL